MTSTLNNDETIRFFEDHNYFGYPKDNIHFFMQGELPIVDKQGKILLKDKSHVLFGPNGNGNVFSALKSSNLLSHMIDNNIQKVLFMPIDNILSILADYQLLGYSLINNHKLITKTVFKEDAYGKEWLFCLYNNKPFVLPTPYLTDEIRFKQDKDGNFLYRDINIAYHLIDIDELKKYADINLKYHRAFKNNKYIDVDGNYVTSNDNNSYKFEQFIFDAFSYSDDMILYRVEKDEFFPIKVQEDINKLNKKDI